MKNVIIFVIIAAAAIIAYSYLQTNDDAGQQQAPSIIETAQEKAQEIITDAAQTATSGLISTAADGADVFILEPADGSTVKSPVTVKFGITNMQVAKAGENIDFSGHHHLLVNLEELPDMTLPLPATEQIIHFGGAQTETTIALTPGQHTLQLLLGNYLHIPHDPPVISRKITITVE